MRVRECDGLSVCVCVCACVCVCVRACVRASVLAHVHTYVSTHHLSARQWDTGNKEREADAPHPNAG
jgi:hypothetical protein